MIDVLSDDTFEYLTGSELTYGGFDSRFTFDWIPVPERENARRNQDKSLPLRSVNPVIEEQQLPLPFMSHVLNNFQSNPSNFN